MNFKIPEELKKDKAYWGQPTWYRLYMRCFYALFGFIATGAFFDIYTPAPFWLQLFLASSVALATLLFRVAYPNGFSGIQEWILEAMLEAQEEAEQRGTPFDGASSAEIKATLETQRKENREKGRETGLPQRRRRARDGEDPDGKHREDR